MHAPILQDLADERVLGALLERVRTIWGGYELLAHHQQGEFHHDIFLRVPGAAAPVASAAAPVASAPLLPVASAPLLPVASAPLLPGEHLVVSTNCNGGVKEVLCFEARVEPLALWHARCPDNAEFSGELPAPLGSARTEHWFDPCGLLLENARSELKAEFRARQPGGGWCKKLES